MGVLFLDDFRIICCLGYIVIVFFWVGGGILGNLDFGFISIIIFVFEVVDRRR